MEKDKDKDFDKVREEAEITKKQKEQEQQTRISVLLQLYQSARAIAKSALSTGDPFIILAENTKNNIIRNLASMITIVEEKGWYKVHPHDAFPKIDIRMLISECPVSSDCACLLAILRKIGMSKEDYIKYRERAGAMIAMEHKRKMGKRG